jgi:DNA-binding NarL/FixJ family response regulator
MSARAQSAITVAIVEDDAGVRTTLASLIGRADGFRCASLCASAEEAVLALPRVRPDVVLVDIKLPGMNGVEGVRRLKALLPETQFIMLTVYQDNDLIFEALAAGATGYLLKRTRHPQLIASIRDVHAGGSPMSSEIARKVVQSFRQTPSSPWPEGETLTPREGEVLELLAKGHRYKEIADTLHVSYDTVHSHVRKIYEKLQVHTRTQAVTLHLTHRGLVRG